MVLTFTTLIDTGLGSHFATYMEYPRVQYTNTDDFEKSYHLAPE